MNARTTLITPAFGELFEGGYLHGIYMLHGEIWGEVTAPKAEGETTGLAWLTKHQDLPGACSDFDGLANTIAMANAGSPLALWAREQRIGGHDDWYIAARGGLLMQRANLQPLLPDEEKFDADKAYASSTQFDRNLAWGQSFGHGYTHIGLKSWEGWSARLARRFLIQ